MQGSHHLRRGNAHTPLNTINKLIRFEHNMLRAKCGTLRRKQRMLRRKLPTIMHRKIFP